MDLGEFIDLIQMPTGRRVFAHQEILPLAVKHGMKTLATHAEMSIAYDRETLQVELTRQGVKQARFSPEATRLDGLVDRAVTGLDLFFESFVRVYGKKRELGVVAAKVREIVLPDGPGAVTSLPYIQEDAAVAAILERLAQKPVQELWSKLPGADGFIAEVAEHHKAYHEVLRKDTEGPTPDEMRARQYEGHQNLCGTVALILEYWVRTRDSETANALLAPIRRQVQDVRTARARRRTPSDVDPDTGEITGEAPGGDEPGEE